MRRAQTALAILAIGAALVAMPAAADVASFDAKPFLAAMLKLKAAAETCNGFVSGNPLKATEGIDIFFVNLKQDVPKDLADQPTRKSLARFIKAQASVLCAAKLDAALADYRVAARLYQAGKPQNWPDAPLIRAAW